MRLPRLLRTASFRLAAGYTVLFTVSTLLLSLAVFLIARNALYQQTRARISDGAAALRSDYAAGGIAALIAEIRARERRPRGLDYLLRSPAGVRLAGELPSVGKLGWQDVRLRDDAGGESEERSERPEHMVVLALRLTDGSLLAVGGDLNGIEAVQTAVIGAFLLVAGLVVLAGILGGVLLSRGFLRRVDAVASTAQAIIDGDMRQRIPVRGTGDDFDQLATTLNTMLDRIAALMESIRHVSSAVAHDLRTPIARVYHDLEAAQSHATTPAAFQAAMEQAKEGLVVVLETFSALLRIAEIETGARRAGFRLLDLSALTVEVAEAFTPSIEEEGHAIRLAVAPGVAITGDRELLTQLLANLLENALRHTPAGCSVTVSLTRRGREAVLAVEDDGPGVPESERRRIFEPFYRAGHRKAAGTGLGLGVVAAIADLHRARVAALDAHPGLRVEVVFAPGARSVP